MRPYGGPIRDGRHCPCGSCRPSYGSIGASVGGEKAEEFCGACAMHKSLSVVVAMMLCSGVAMTASATPASSVVPSWSVVPSVSPGIGSLNGSFSAVACATATTCFAAGSGPYASLMEQWDGAHWSIVATPGGSLSDIACPGAASCFAVGVFNGVPVIEHWNGTAWSIAASPSVPGTAMTLNSVACTSAASCVAVGGGVLGTGEQTLVERWNGTAWSVVPSPRPSDASGGSELAGVACATAKNCFAVGSFSNGFFPFDPFIEHWNGAAWSIVPGPTLTTTTVPAVDSVSCPTSTSCFAVGSIQTFSAHTSATTTLIERWNGRTWSIVTSPNVPSTGLADVSCPTTTNCFAVGSIVPTVKGTGHSHNLIERWNGTRWSIVASPNLDPDTDSLNSVACTSATSCFAVGSNASGSSPGTIEHWNGTKWSIATHPMPFDNPNNNLADVTCAGATCFAVGQYQTTTGTTVTLIEQPTASGWTVVPSPNPPGATTSALIGVSCPSTTLCIAVGASMGKTLIERWNGSTWSIVPSPNRPSSSSSGLSSVSCTGATNCMAVGSFNGGQTLIERWNGTAWTIVPSPNYALQPPFVARQDVLSSVSCASATSCFAVGSDYNVAGGSGLGTKTFTLIERWNGSTWTIVPSPNPGAPVDLLLSVTCPSANSCFAVGMFSVPLGGGVHPGPEYSLIVYWNGTAWAQMASANPTNAVATQLTGIACSTPTSCLAVGETSDGSAYSTLIETLTGTSWSIVPGPTSPANSSLNAVSCACTSNCYSVGNTESSQTLVEQYS